MANPFDDIIQTGEPKKTNPFDDLVPDQPTNGKPANPFDDLVGPQMVDLSRDETRIQQRVDNQVDFDEWGLPTAPMVDAYLGRITKNRDKAANIMAMSEIYAGDRYGKKLAPSIVNDRYDELNTLKDQPEGYRFIPQLAIAGGMLAAPVAIAAGAIIPGLTVAGGTIGVKAAIPMWKFLLGAGAFTAAEEVNAFVRSKAEGTRFSETRPYSLVDLAPTDADGSLKTLLGVLDIMAKGKALHVGYKGLNALWEPFVRDTIVQHGMPRRVYVDANLASDVMRGTATEEQMSLWRDLGITAEELRAAKHGGFQLEIPAEKLVTVADKPWYAKLKSLFRVSPYEETTVEPGSKRTVTPVAGLLEEPGKAEGAKSAPEPIQPTVTPRPPVQVPEAYQPMVEKAATAAVVDADLVARVARAESNWNPAAVSAMGARGIMQLMPGTARDLGVLDSSDPYDNLKGGAKYLRQMLDRYNGDETRALVAYNWGPRNADAWDGNPETLPKETQDYLVRVQGGEPGKAPRISRQPSRVDLGQLQAGGLTTEGLLDGMARGNVDFALSPPSEDDTILSMARESGKGDITTGTTPTPEGGAKWALQHYEANAIPDNWFVHGRALRQDLDTGTVLFLSKDWDTARDYAGSNGSMWLVAPKKDAVLFDARSSENIESLFNDLRKAREDELLTPDLDKLVDNYLEYPDRFPEDVNPEKIRSRGGLWDNQDFAYWLYETKGIDFVLTDDGAVVINPEAIRKTKVPQSPSPSSPPSGGGRFAISQGAPNAEPGRQEPALYFPTTPEQVRSIEQSLVDELGDGVRGTIRAPEGTIGEAHQRAADAAQRLGLEPVFFECTNHELDVVGGFVERTRPGTIYLNASSYANLEYITYHEAIHTLANTNATAYSGLEAEVLVAVNSKGFEKYDAWLDDQRLLLGLPALDTPYVVEEFVSDLAGSLFSGVSHALKLEKMFKDPAKVKALMEEALGYQADVEGPAGVKFAVTGDPTISTTVPTAKTKKPGIEVKSKATVLSEAMQDERWTDRVADAIKAYPGRPVQIEMDPAKTIESFIRDGVDNIVWLVENGPKEIVELARQWYKGANRLARRFATAYGVPVEGVSGVLAALSPQKDWYMNVSLAERVIDIALTKANEPWSKAMARVAKAKLKKDQIAAIKDKSLSEIAHPIARAMWVRIYDEAHNTRSYRNIWPDGTIGEIVKTMKGVEAKVAWGSFSEISKALMILQDPSPESISNILGPYHKVRNFYNNIASPDAKEPFVTVDTHAVSASLLRPLSGYSKEVTHNFGGPGSASSSHTGVYGTYPIYGEIYIEAAKKLGMMPREVQSVAWELVRNLFKRTFKAQERNLEQIDQVWHNYANGEVDLDAARKEILTIAGGIDIPEWARPGAGVHEEQGHSTYQKELPRAGLRERGPAGVGGGTRSNAPTGTPRISFALAGEHDMMLSEAEASDLKALIDDIPGAEDAKGTTAKYRREAEKLGQLAIDFANRATAPRALPERGRPLGGVESGDTGHADLASTRVLAKAFRSDLIKRGYIDVIGKKVSTTADVAHLCQVLRDPTCETFHWIMVKDGKIATAFGVTIGVPGRTMAYPEEGPAFVRRQIDRVQADAVYVVHNHPSGNPEPSQADIRLSHMTLFKDFPEIKDHIIIDSGKYAVISRGDVLSSVTIKKLKVPKGWRDKLLSPEVPNPLLGLQVHSTDIMASVAKTLLDERTAHVLIYLDSKNRIRGIQEIPPGLIADQKAAEKWIRNRLVDFGSTRAILYIPEESQMAFRDAHNLWKAGQLLDVIDAFGNSSIALEGVVPWEEESSRQRWQGLHIPTTPRQLVTEEQKPFGLKQRPKFQTYDDVMAEASRRASEVIEERMAKERSRLEAQVRRQAEAIVNEDPLQQTVKQIVALRGFSPTHLKKLGYGEDMISNLRSVHRGLVTKSGRARADEIAIDTGLWDGADALLEQIINSPSRSEAVARMTRELMAEQKTKREINAADTYAELLNEEIKILKELTKGTTDAWANKPTPGIKRTIEEMVGIRKVAEADTVTEHDALKAAMKKAQTAARQAYTAGNRAGALAAKMKEREIFEIYRTKLEARRVVDRLTRALQKSVRIPANELKAGGIKPEYRDVIHSILSPYHRELKFNPMNPSGMTHAQFLQYMDDSGELTVHDPDRINAFTRKPWRELDINELREIMGAVGEVIYLAKREGKLIAAGRKQSLDDLVRSLAKRIYETTGKRGIDIGKTPQEILEARDEGKTTSPSMFERYRMSRRKIEFLCRDLDGWEENGPVWRAIFAPTAEAEANQIRMTEAKAGELDDIFKRFSEQIGGKKLSTWLKEKVVIRGVGKVFSRHRLMMVYLNSGNEGNLRALRAIFPQEEIDAINASFTPEEIRLFNDLHALVDTLFEPLAEVYRAMTGQRLKKVEGRYWPIVLDQEMSMRAEEIKSNESQKDLFANVFTPPAMKRGFEIERTGTRLPPKLDLSVLFKHLEEVVHRITHAEAVRNIQKIVTHEDFKTAVISTRGRAFYDQFMPWLQHVANPRKDTSISVWDRGADKLRQNATLNLLGYSITTVMKSLFDWTTVVPELGFIGTTSGFYNYLKHPRETVAFVNSMSAEMTNFMASFDRELATMYEKIVPTMNPVKRRIMESAFAWLGMVEQINRYPVWLEAYSQAIEGRGRWKGNPQTPEAAAVWADSMVRRVKAMASPKDMAAITRGRGMQKLMTMFYTEASKVDNLMSEYWSRTRHDPNYGYFDYLRALFWILVVGPIFTEVLIRRRPPKPQEAAADIAGFYVGRFPFIRDIATAILTGFDYTPTPAVKGGESLVKLGGDALKIFSGKKLKKGQEVDIAVHAADAIALLNPGPWGGFPTRQMITFIKGLIDLQTGRSKSPASLYDRSAEKKRKQDLKSGVR